MPELPEVETVRTALEGAIKDAQIKKVTLRRADLRIPFPPDLPVKLAGSTIQRIERRAKYLLIHLDSGDVMIAHLGMTGRFSVEAKAPKTFDAHDHLVIHLDDGRCVIYNDARRFGVITLCASKELVKHPLIEHLGPEPLGKEFTATYLKNALKNRSASIKSAIMDQEVVVGVGNIYASEALFLSGILPDRPANTVLESSALLAKNIKKVLRAALASGGSSLRDFYHVSGETGYFQHQFNVYDRAGEACIRCDSSILSVRIAGRSSFFCPSCQK